MAWRGYPAGMPQDSLIRVGRGVPGAQRNRPKWPLLVVAAAALAGVTALVAVVIFYDKPAAQSPQAVASTMDNRVECASIAHAYDVWKRGRDDLEYLRTDSNGTARLNIAPLIEAGHDFAKAATGYPAAVKTGLVVAIATYNVKLSFVDLYVSAGSEIPEPQHTDVLRAWTEVEQTYDYYRSATC